MQEIGRASHLSREEMASVQRERLNRQVEHAYGNVPFYRQAMDDRGVQPADIRSLDDLRHLPFTTKADIQERFPLGLCAVPRERIRRVHSSSGSTGRPINTCYTQEDLDDWALCMARNLAAGGLTSADISQIAFRYSLFTGAFGHHLGVERLGAAIIPTSSGQTERQILMMQSFGTTALHCTPSYALVIAEKLEQLGIDPATLALRLAFCGAEPTTDLLRDEIEKRLGVRLLRDYGLTELGGCGVSAECEAQDGYHINEDFFYPEVIDPETGEPLPDGELGELVFTTLAKEGVPVLRYRTRDLSTLTRTQCSCGRTLARHGLILGRTDDMLIVGGVNFFPTQVEAVVCGFDELSPHYQIDLWQENRRDVVCVEVEVDPHHWAACAGDVDPELAARVGRGLYDVCGFRIAVRVREPFALARSEGKSRRVIDRRSE